MSTAVRPICGFSDFCVEDGRARRRRASTRSSASPARPPTPATCRCRACSTRACCAARTRTRASAASTPRRRARCRASRRSSRTRTAASSGAPARSPAAQQYNDEVKKITTQRRYAFNNPVRFVGEPVAAVAAVDRHVAEEALQLIAVDYEVLPFVLDPEEALEPDAVEDLAGRQPLAEQPQRAAAARTRSAATSRTASRRPITCSRIATRPRSCTTRRWSRASALAHWDGDKLTVYTPTGGIANCRTTSRAISASRDEKVRVVCQYMGGNFGNKNQNQDADLITAMLAKEAGAPVKLELSRKEDFIGMHGRWPTVQYYKVGVDARRHAARRFSCAATAAWGRTARTRGAIGRHRAVPVPERRDRRSTPVYTNRTVSANFRGPEYPQGFFGIQSMMDDVAYKLKMDPVEFVAEEHDAGSRATRRRSPTTRSRSASAAAPRLFDWKTRWRPRRARTPARSSAAPACRSWRSAPGSAAAAPSSASTPNGRYTLFVGVTDVGGGAKTTMGLIAAEALGVPLSQVDVVWGDTDRCPYSVGESGSRTTIMTGYAVVEAARDLQKQIAEKGHADRRRRCCIGVGDAEPDARGQGAQLPSARTSSRSRSTPSSAACASLKYVAVHDCGPHHESAHGARARSRAARRWASAWRCTRTCSTTAAPASR